METVQWQQLLADLEAAATVAPATPADTGYEVAVQTDISMVDILSKTICLHLKDILSFQKESGIRTINFRTLCYFLGV